MSENQDTPAAGGNVAGTGDIVELRGHLMATIRAMRANDERMDCERARAVSQVAGTVIDSLRVENEFLRVTGNDRGTGFIPDAPAPAAPAGQAEQIGQPRQKADPIGAVTRHLLR